MGEEKCVRKGGCYPWLLTCRLGEGGGGWSIWLKEEALLPGDGGRKACDGQRERRNKKGHAHKSGVGKSMTLGRNRTHTRGKTDTLVVTRNSDICVPARPSMPPFFPSVSSCLPPAWLSRARPAKEDHR